MSVEQRPLPISKNIRLNYLSFTTAKTQKSLGAQLSGLLKQTMFIMVV